MAGLSRWQNITVVQKACLVGNQLVAAHHKLGMSLFAQLHTALPHGHMLQALWLQSEHRDQVLQARSEAANGFIRQWSNKQHPGFLALQHSLHISAGGFLSDKHRWLLIRYAQIRSLHRSKLWPQAELLSLFLL